MPISSVSRVYDAPDPILETDLELLAKVNTWQQEKFDTGAAALQNEVDKWAMMSQIAKPELKAYANEKLNKLVSGINNLGGVNLSDINNVNSLKGLGYNIYGDSRITDGVLTTQKMNALAADARAKLSGKDAGKYDSAVSDYLMKGYQEWANDGNADNTRYDGPIDLPQGNMNTINEKVQKYLKELKPDSESTPSGDLQKSYGYFQVDGKWLKGDRIQEAINAVTDQNDDLVFRAHGWRAMNGESDRSLLSKLGMLYDNTTNDIKNQINYLQAELNQTTDAGKKMQIQNLINQQIQSLATNQQEQASFASKPALSQQEREGIQSSLYKNAWKSNIVNSFGYRDQKTELKANMPLIYHDRMQQQAYQWSQDHNLAVSRFELDKLKTIHDIEQDRLKNAMNFSFNTPFGVPLTQEANRGESNQQASPKGFMDNINATYFQKNAQYYNYLYNTLGSNDAAGRYYQDENKNWKPRPEYRDQIQQELELLTSKIDNYSNLTDEEKKSLNLPTDQNELNGIFQLRNEINTYNAYKTMAQGKEDEIVNHAITSGTIDFDWRKVPISIGSDYKQTTVGEALALYKAGVYDDNTAITGIGTMPESSKGYKLDTDSMKDLLESVDKIRDDAEKSYEKVGGKMFNSFSVPFPFEKLDKTAQEIIQKQLSSKIDGVDYNSIQPIKGYIDFNFKTGRPEYKLEVQAGTGKKLGRQTLDITDMLQSSPNAGIGIYYPKSDISLIWGLSLDNNGATPFSKTDNYKNSLRTTVGNYPYRVSRVSNALDGTTGLKVKVAVPVGNGNTVEVDVKNLKDGSNTFPSSLEAVQQYLDGWFSSPELKQRFYKEHGLEITP